MDNPGRCPFCGNSLEGEVHKVPMMAYGVARNLREGTDAVHREITDAHLRVCSERCAKIASGSDAPTAPPQEARGG